MAVPRAMAGPALSADSFILQTQNSDLLLQRKERQASTSLQNKTWGWAMLMTVQAALQVNLHWEIVLARD